jgi:hypothetical protein
MPDDDEFEGAAEASDEWERFREEDGDPIDIEELKGLNPLRDGEATPSSLWR